TGVLRLSNVPSLIVRPEAIVNIQRQLELTIGGSSKGILYLSGERSAQEGMNPLESVLSTRAPLTLANARRLMDVSALLGWGRLEMSLFDPEHGRLVLTVSNSPLARAYGSSKKPVCHFLTGWIAGLGRNLLEREVLCEETACAAQGPGRCEGLHGRTVRRPREHGLPHRGHCPHDLVRFAEARSRSERQLHGAEGEVRRVAREEGAGGGGGPRDGDSRRRPLARRRTDPRRPRRPERPRRRRRRGHRGRSDVGPDARRGPQGGPGAPRGVHRGPGDA